MSEKATINERRLTKKQVQEYINTVAVINEEYNRIFNFENSFGNSYYNMPDGNYLLVFGDNGKGDIWKKEVLDKWAERQRVLWERRSLNIPRGTYGHWFYFSENKNEISSKIDFLSDGLFKKLDLDESNGDFSYKSLDLISEKLNQLGIGYVEENLLDDLLAYCGEVMRRKIGGVWVFEMREDFQLGEFIHPRVTTENEKVFYDPIRSYYDVMFFGGDFDLRKEVIKEVKSNSGRRKYRG